MTDTELLLMAAYKAGIKCLPKNWNPLSITYDAVDCAMRAGIVIPFPLVDTDEKRRALVEAVAHGRH